MNNFTQIMKRSLVSGLIIIKKWVQKFLIVYGRKLSMLEVSQTDFRAEEWGNNHEKQQYPS